MTPYRKHLETYRSGCGNAICSGAKHVCLVRGALPADILFVGEGPGESEDVLGQPFIGPAGKLLDSIIEAAVPKVWAEDPKTGATAEGYPYRMSWTNLVGCIPRDDDGGKAAAPDLSEIRTCNERLKDVIRIARPRLLVRVGALSAKYCPLAPKAAHVDLVHPAAILKANIASRDHMFNTAVIRLRDAVEQLT